VCSAHECTEVLTLHTFFCVTIVTRARNLHMQKETASRVVFRAP
jgi:hypothetical protein